MQLGFNGVHLKTHLRSFLILTWGCSHTTHGVCCTHYRKHHVLFQLQAARNIIVTFLLLYGGKVASVLRIGWSRSTHLGGLHFPPLLDC
jgi:hypothetical protein